MFTVLTFRVFGKSKLNTGAFSMANTRNGFNLRAKDIDAASTGALLITQPSGLGIELAVQYDGTTITASGENKLQVGTIAITNVDQLQSTINTINGRINALETGSVDLSNYVSDSGISIIGSTSAANLDGGGIRVNGDGTNDTYVGTFTGTGSAWTPNTTLHFASGSMSFITATGLDPVLVVSSTTFTYDGNKIVTEASKNQANGYAGLDGNSKLTASQIPIGTGLTLSGSEIAVDASQFIAVSEKGATSGVAPLTNGKIPMQYIDTLPFKECYSATVADGTITLGEGQSKTEPSQLEIGDEIILTAATTWNSTEYAIGSMFVRIKTTDGTLTDYAYMSTGIIPATIADVNTGTDNTKFITPAALKGSAPTILGTNITNIPGTAITVADGANLGVVKVTDGNGLTISAGTIAMAAAGAGTFGAVKLGTTDGSVPVINASNKLEAAIIPVATATTLGGVIVEADSGLTLGADGKLSVTSSGTPDPIALSEENYDSDAGTVTVDSITPPKGIVQKVSPYTFLCVPPDTATPKGDGAGYTFVMDVSGITSLNTTDWEVVF